MKKTVKRLCILGSVWITAVGAGVPAQAAEFTSSNGATLAAPEMEQLTCAERGELLLEYSISGYRGTEPVAEGHPDRVIYEYENQLAQVYYMQCRAGSSHYQNSAPAFSQGFN